MTYSKIYFEKTGAQHIIYFKDKQCTILHREDGPAIEYVAGYKEWWLNDKRHRKDGPAIEYLQGDAEYWLHGIQYSKEEYWKIVQLGEFV